jgi:hypothetical protein
MPPVTAKSQRPRPSERPEARHAEHLVDATVATYRRIMRGGLLMLALVTGGVVGAVWCVFNGSHLWEWLLALGRLVHVVPARPPVPDGMPLERIAADLRRMRAQARRQPSGTPMERRRAIVAAYDDALLDACRALEVPTELDLLTDPLERESERLRTESELERAGVDLS